MLEVKNVTKNYGSLRAVDGVSFRLDKGEALGLLGPNAAGKTTLMRIMAGYLPADGGSVLLDGMDIAESPVAVKRRLGYLPEIPPLYNDMTVKSYLLFASEIKGVPKQARASRADEVMERTGVADVAGRLIRNISKGYRQRVGLAQAMIHNPDVLILDEPTVGLDPNQIIEIRNLIKELSATNTILLSSHILTEVSATCDRVVILNEGRVAAVDTQEGLARRLRGGDSLTVEVAGAKPGEAAQTFLSSRRGRMGWSLRRRSLRVRSVSPSPAARGSTLAALSFTRPQLPDGLCSNCPAIPFLWKMSLSN